MSYYRRSNIPSLLIISRLTDRDMSLIIQRVTQMFMLERSSLTFIFLCTAGYNNVKRLDEQS